MTGASGRSKRPTSIDQIVGSRVRLRRKMLRMSQADLGQSLGISFQQIQKYELGINRIGVGRLVEMANILEMPITYFLDDIYQERLSLPDRLGASGRLRSKFSNQSVEVATLFAQIEDPALRKKIKSLLQTIAENQG